MIQYYKGGQGLSNRILVLEDEKSVNRGIAFSLEKTGFEAVAYADADEARMVISVTARKKEYGIMQAVGMTDGQLNRVIRMQGMIFTAGTLAVSLGTGIPAGYAVFRYCRAHSYFGMNMYHFPAAEVLIMAAVLVIMQLCLSFILSRNIRKESPVDRIRYSS